jgi:hypothetical protein
MVLPFANLLNKLQDMVFSYMMNSEDSKDSTVKAERTGPNSRPFWGVPYASKEFQRRYGQAYRLRAACLARQSPQNHENELAKSSRQVICTEDNFGKHLAVGSRATTGSQTPAKSSLVRYV